MFEPFIGTPHHKQDKQPQTKESLGHAKRNLTNLCARSFASTAFILYRQAWQAHFAAQHPGLANPEISKLIGEKWREQPEDVKNTWKQLAEEEKIRHQRQYPGYRYQPRRGGKNATGRPSSSGGDNPGHCPKCGGRYIATPRTPSTSFEVASPSPPKRTLNMQPYMASSRMEADYPRQGSMSAGPLSVDPHGRRYTQPHMRDIDEDYPIMSPMAAPLSGGIPPPPSAKRPRYNGMMGYGGPASPHMAYAPDPRFPQRPSVNGPPMSSTGYGPEHLAGPPPGQIRRPPAHPNHPGYPHMQPPPPPRSMSYQQMPTPNRPNSGFDESLRLPPLQTPVQETSPMVVDAGSRHPMRPAQPPPQPTGLGIMNGGPVRQPPPPAPPSPMPQKWPFLLKLEVLRSISPPLRPPGAGGPVFETRGPIIAVEGAPTVTLKEVATVIERALSVSAEFAVKVWSEDTSTAIAHSSPEPHASADGNGNEATPKDSNNANNNGAVQRKQPSFISPIANYVARMLKWHKTSEDLIRYITSCPQSGDGASSAANNNNNNTNTPTKLPVAILSDGYSLTFSDKYASALHVNDAYRQDDHWQWVATLWRGVVGADLTVYVKKAVAPEDTQGNNCVEMAAPGVMVLRLPEHGAPGRGMVIDEKLERRLGFEIAEWVRGGSFGIGFGK
ncbi:hypothetical protein GGR57DRAFT_463713 [Xylariaceae sp. FL1272]|nr:hypothetical protein GGR57DRAFT_463713 [Xylariaceae sp. FL1272]